MIWAQDSRRALGSGTGMLWHVPADFQYFKNRTLGHPIIMGRATWESMDSQPLPGRTTYVITRQAEYVAPGATVVSSLEDAVDAAGRAPGGELIWIIGGGQIFELGMEIADFLSVSELDLDASTSADQVVYAPVIDPAVWYRDAEESDAEWRAPSVDARWKVQIWRRRR